MTEANEKAVIRLEIEDSNMGEDGAGEKKIQVVEIEVLPPIDINDERQVEIYNGLTEIEEKQKLISNRVKELNSEIDELTNHADGLDNAVAVASGIIAGVIDSVWVGELSIDRANEWGNEKADNIVVKIAQKQGYEGEDVLGAIKYLEDKFHIAADKAMNDFGGATQHHLRDFSHHPTLVGLFFSLLTQFTGNVYGTDVTGAFKVVPVNAGELIGKNLPEKITFGVVKWFFHMVSDIAGSSDSVSKGSRGTGLPGPIVSFLKEISTLPIFQNMNEKGYKEFSVWISKLFNGTLLGKRDANGKIIEAIKFDLRTEIGLVNELGRQALPVLLNECVVRAFYFSRRLFTEIKEKDIKTISDLNNIDWEGTLPYNNRTVARMLTISTGTFVACDVADAAIRSGGFNAACILRLNFVGIGRFAVAVGTDIGMGVQKAKKERELSDVINEYIALGNIKLYYREADLLCTISNLYEKEADMHVAEAEIWKEVQNNAEAIQGLYEQIHKTCQHFSKNLNDMNKDFQRIETTMSGLEKFNPGLREKLLERLH